MGFLNRLYVTFREDRINQGIAEYALIVAAVAIVAMAGYTVFGWSVNKIISEIGGNM